MWPVIQVGPLAIQSYGLCLLFGAYLGLSLSARLANELCFDGDHLYNGLFYGLVTGFVVARLWHVVTYWPAYAAEPVQLLSLNLNALVPWPGIIAGGAVSIVYFWRQRLPLWSVADALTPGALVALMGNAAGNLLAGTAFGLPANLPWAVPLWGANRHPTQVYEFIALGAVLAWLWPHRLKGASLGYGTTEGLLAYGLIRLTIDAYRADSLLLPGGLRLAQVLGLALAVLALTAMALRQMQTASLGEAQGKQ